MALVAVTGRVITQSRLAVVVMTDWPCAVGRGEMAHDTVLSSPHSHQPPRLIFALTEELFKGLNT